MGPPLPDLAAGKSGFIVSSRTGKKLQFDEPSDDQGNDSSRIDIYLVSPTYVLTRGNRSDSIGSNDAITAPTASSAADHPLYAESGYIMLQRAEVGASTRTPGRGWRPPTNRKRGRGRHRHVHRTHDRPVNRDSDRHRRHPGPDRLQCLSDDQSWDLHVHDQRHRRAHDLLSAYRPGPPPARRRRHRHHRNLAADAAPPGAHAFRERDDQRLPLWTPGRAVDRQRLPHLLLPRWPVRRRDVGRRAVGGGGRNPHRPERIRQLRLEPHTDIQLGGQLKRGSAHAA